MSRQPCRDILQAGIVLVRNHSGGDLNRLALVGVTPAEKAREGKFVVLAEPIASGKIGRAYAVGVCPAKIDVPDENHEYPFAETADGVTDNLKATHYGSAVIRSTVRPSRPTSLYTLPAPDSEPT